MLSVPLNFGPEPIIKITPKGPDTYDVDVTITQAEADGGCRITVGMVTARYHDFDGRCLQIQSTTPGTTDYTFTNLTIPDEDEYKIAVVVSGAFWSTTYTDTLARLV
ncbi:hypothetical protein F4821DRAFT_258283 [Hypoxylon rubiginosum]|uniref:Uncharacterized protein n=1 Tax=Hypoxylon rubiginosum TaxID=110542 RepID=A0ACC0D5S8_9PEZI|nr:hypothetical protein F4821DRAFT_258283 [Hypoxylon rubiginosum]